MKILRNSYALGVLMVVGELIINNVLLAAQFPLISGIILALFAGWIYSKYNKEKMSPKERIKTLVTYLILVGAAGMFVALAEVGTTALGVTIAIMLGLLLVYAILMYFMLGLGSSSYMTTYEKKRTTAQHNILQQNALTPVPYAKKFLNRYPKIALIIVITVLATLFIGMVFMAADPLMENHMRLLMGVCAVCMAWIIVLLLWGMFGKKKFVAVISSVVLGLTTFGIFMFISNLPAPAPGADTLMIKYQEAALRCMDKGENIGGTHHSRLKRGIPRVESLICVGETTRWEKLPDGWAYTRIIDGNVSDGTFTFGAKNRLNEYILCGERWCGFRNEQGSTTVLSDVLSPFKTSVTLPESRDVRPGERIEVAVVTLTNPTDTPADLKALWYTKSGTASNNAIETVYIVEGESTSSMNYLHFLGRSSDDKVYIDHPDMFTLEPQQSRTYSLQISLNENIPLEIGKTIGLDLVGFSYPTQVWGMPAQGAVHTIVQ